MALELKDLGDQFKEAVKGQIGAGSAPFETLRQLAQEALQDGQYGKVSLIAKQLERLSGSELNGDLEPLKVAFQELLERYGLGMIKSEPEPKSLVDSHKPDKVSGKKPGKDLPPKTARSRTGKTQQEAGSLEATTNFHTLSVDFLRDVDKICGIEMILSCKLRKPEVVKKISDQIFSGQDLWEVAKKNGWKYEGQDPLKDLEKSCEKAFKQRGSKQVSEIEESELKNFIINLIYSMTKDEGTRSRWAVCLQHSLHLSLKILFALTKDLMNEPDKVDTLKNILFPRVAYIVDRNSIITDIL